ncbi:MAG TPA: YCF48-related protein, partial [Ignavibacteriaceae bacterium]|nr:YCF48-related protein [Ignavibacteriaceae bacterium]
MKKLDLLILLLFCQINLYSQWYIINPIPDPIPGLNYTSIDFVDSLNGWAATNKGFIIRTYDGGKNWITQTAGITSVIRKLRFADLLNGWAVGDSGKIIHTTNGGETWILQNSLPNMQLTMLSVINSQNVWAAGTWGSNNQGIMLHTT